MKQEPLAWSKIHRSQWEPFHSSSVGLDQAISASIKEVFCCEVDDHSYKENQNKGQLKQKELYFPYNPM